MLHEVFTSQEAFRLCCVTLKWLGTSASNGKDRHESNSPSYAYKHFHLHQGPNKSTKQMQLGFCQLGQTHILGWLHKGFQVPLVLASSNMETNPNYILTLVKPFEAWPIFLIVRSWLFYTKILGLVLQVGYGFLLNLTFSTSPEHHLQRVLSCRHPCHTCDLGRN